MVKIFSHLLRLCLLFSFTFCFYTAIAQNYGIGTFDPTHTLHVKPDPGNEVKDPVRFENLQPYIEGQDSMVIVANPATGVMRVIPLRLLLGGDSPVAQNSVTGDNFGNHIATKHLTLKGFGLSYNGQHADLTISEKGYIGIGEGLPMKPLQVNGAARFFKGNTKFDIEVGDYFGDPTRYWTTLNFDTNKEGGLAISGNVKIEKNFSLLGLANDENLDEVLVTNEDGLVKKAPFVSLLLQNLNVLPRNNGEAFDYTLKNNWLSGDGGQEGIFINSEGQVGIGTNTPESALQIEGGVKIKEGIQIGGITEDNTLDNILLTDQEGNIRQAKFQTLMDKFMPQSANPETPEEPLQGLTQLNDNWLSNDGDSEGLFIDNEGQVGLGTNNPQAELQVGGNVIVDKGLKISEIGVDDKLNDVLLTDAAGNVKKSSFKNLLDRFLEIPEPELRPIYQLDGNWLSGDGGNEGVFINEDGKVGIGTDQPGTDLHISGDFRQSGANTQFGYQADNELKLSLGEGRVQNGTGNFSIYGAASSQGKLEIQRGPGANGSSHIVNEGNGNFAIKNGPQTDIFIDNNNNVGINMSNPNNTLDVNGDIDWKTMHWHHAENIIMHSPSSGWGNFSFDFTQNDGYDYFVVYAPNETGNIFYVQNNGLVAINNSAPTEALDVKGNIRVREVGTATSAGALHITANGTFTTSTSDRRLKENIRPISNALDKVKRLKGVNFSWKDQEGSNKLGLIAQEVQEVVPELVFQNQQDGYYGVHYQDAIGLLVEAIKEQQKQIEALQQANDQLKAEANSLTALQQKVKDMEAMIQEVIKGKTDSQEEVSAENE